MAGAVTEFVVKGRAEVEAAFMEMRREVLTGIRPALLAAAKPIAADAHRKTVEDITNIGEPWSEFRIGATVHTVYVAPKRRRRGGSPRPNLAPMLFREMEAAVARNQDVALLAMEAVVDAAAAQSGLAV